MSDLGRHVDAALEAVVGRGRPLLVAVSGGSDSVGLLAVLSALDGWRDRLVVGHVDHGVRPDSTRDAALVRGLDGGVKRLSELEVKRPKPFRPLQSWNGRPCLNTAFKMPGGKARRPSND